MDREKDRLGDKLRDKERGQEEDYFARRDRELIEKLRRQREPSTGGAATPRCARCGASLASSEGHEGDGAVVCPACGSA